MNLVEITIRATDADALAKVAEIKAALDTLGRTTNDINRSTDKSGGVTNWLAKIANLIPGVTANTGLAGAAFISLGAVAIGVIASILASLSVLLISMGLITAGVAGFAAIAVPEFMKVWTAVGQGDKAIDKLPKSLQPVAQQVLGLKDQFDKLIRAVQPQIITAFTEALRILKDLMPALKPLIKDAGKAIDDLLKNMDQWLKSPAGQKFIQWFRTEAPIVMRNFARVAWDVIRGVGSTLHWLWDTGQTFARNWSDFWHNSAKVIDGFRIGFIQMGHQIEAAYNNIRHAASVNLDQTREAWISTGHDIENAWNVTFNFVRNVVNIAKDSIIIAFDQILLAADRTALAITTTFGHLPGPLGAPFRAASAVIRASMAQAQASVNSAVANIKASIASIQGKTVVINVVTQHSDVYSPNNPLLSGRKAAGGIVGAASGMITSGMTLVGEQGPELVKLPVGSTVYPSGQSMGMMNRNGGPIQIELMLSSDRSQLGEALIHSIRPIVRTRFGGNVQLALGYY